MKRFLKIILYVILAFIVGFLFQNLNKKNLSNEQIDLAIVEKNEIQKLSQNQDIILEDIGENILKESIEESLNTEEKNEVTVVKKEIKFTCPKPSKEYIDMSFLNIGQNISLIDKSYIPKNLELLDSTLATRSDICLEKNTKEAFKKMVEDAKKEGITIKATSGFRSYTIQKSILDEVSRIKQDAGKFVAKPGYSEHQLGTTIDISGASTNYGSADRAFGGSMESEWLKLNSYKYGFIMSYPFGKEEITGYAYEPWHYRYIGEENAKNIFEKDITITEYLASFPEL